MNDAFSTFRAKLYGSNALPRNVVQQFFVDVMNTEKCEQSCKCIILIGQFAMHENTMTSTLGNLKFDIKKLNILNIRLLSLSLARS